MYCSCGMITVEPTELDIAKRGMNAVRPTGSVVDPEPDPHGSGSFA